MSNVVSMPISAVDNENIITNSTFDSGSTDWGIYKESGGKGTLSTDNGKLALTMGQVKVQTNTAVQRYLLFYCGILVGIGSSKYSGITDYSASTY